MPSLSLSGSGQPSSSSKPSKSSGSSGHLSTSSLMPSPSRSPIDGSKMKPMNARRSRGLEARRCSARARAEHEVRLRSTKTLMPPMTSFGELGPGIAAAAEELRQVRLADEVDRLEDAKRDAESAGEAGCRTRSEARRRSGRTA